MVTRAQAKAHFNHVLDNVLERGEESILKQALCQQGFGDLPSILSMEDNDIDQLFLRDDDGTTTHIIRGDVSLMRAFRRYVAYRISNGPLEDGEWYQLDAQDFNSYRLANVNLPRTNSRRNVTRVRNGATPLRPHTASLTRDTTRIAPTPTNDDMLSRTWPQMSKAAMRSPLFAPTDPSTPKANSAEEDELSYWQKYTYVCMENKTDKDDGGSDPDERGGITHTTIKHHRTADDGTHGCTIPGQTHPDDHSNDHSIIHEPAFIPTIHMAYMAMPRSLVTTPPSLVDRGANVGMAGADVRVIGITNRQVAIHTAAGHQMAALDIGTVGAFIHTQKGAVIGIFQQYACLEKGPTIHSAAQLEHYGNEVSDKSFYAGGHQRICTTTGHTMQLQVIDGLARLDMRPYTDAEFVTLPHVFMTDGSDWDPRIIDNDNQWNPPTPSLILSHVVSTWGGG